MPTDLRQVGGTGDTLAMIERSQIVKVLQRERGNKARAARVLGVNRRSLYRLIEKYDIRPHEQIGISALS